ncbi:ankyrin-3-like [Paramacrobiotus metropolitanus]|uniref:ankyrin-3-like n=1 Tax=Paramacrobiotus metropolitanus TaxID=2943436 RepID=UPI0024462137|nr:ankyrin-3-like [Paramacrobiotus metropolitanus]
MHLAARRGSKDIVDLLLDHAAVQDTMSIHKKTPLHYAAEFGSIDVCQQLLQMGSDPAAKDEYGQTPLHLAAHADQDGVFDLFMGLPAGLKLLTPTDWNGLNIAHIAAQQGSIRVITRLLDVDRHLVVSSKIQGTDSTALHLAAINGHAEVLRVLLENGADATQENKEGFNPLHLTAKVGNISGFRVLQNYLTLRTCSMKIGLNAVHIAAYYGQMNFLREVLEHVPVDTKSEQPTVNNAFVKETAAEPGLTALHLACKAGQDDVIRLLLTFPECDPDATSTTTGAVPFHFAARSGNIAAANLLMGRADVNIADHKGRTTLMFAVIAGNMEFCKLLMDHDVDVLVQDQNGFTALHFAAATGKLDLVKQLLDHGAQPECRTKAGKTPLKVAVGARQLDTVRFLLKQPYNSTELAEDREFLYNLMICSKLARQRPLEEFIIHAQSPVEVALKVTEFYRTAATMDREYEHDLAHSSYFCSALTYDLLQIACQNTHLPLFSSHTIFNFVH